MQNNHVAALVLAGGLGTRLSSVLPNTPKCLAPVLDQPFVYWLIKSLNYQGINRIHFSLGHLSNQVISYLESKNWPNTNISWSIESLPMGTAGGFLQAAQASDISTDYWLVMNGDSLSNQSIPEMIKFAITKKADLTIMAALVTSTTRFGTIISNNNEQLCGFSEKKAGQGLVSSGIYLIKKNCLEDFSKNVNLSFEYDVFPDLINSSKNIYVSNQIGQFIDIGTPESLQYAANFINNNKSIFGGAV